MRFVNDTPLEAALVKSAEKDNRIRTLVVAAQSFDITAGGLALSEVQRPIEREAGADVPNDVTINRGGITSVCATGYVYPNQRGDREALVRLRVGTRDVDVLAVGERRWTRGVGTLSPSRPKPIDRIAMNWQLAFGGSVTRAASTVQIDGERALVCGHQACFPLNPDGTGFYLSPSDAHDGLLPQLEDPAQRIERWDDYPPPTCLAPYPCRGGLRAGFILNDGNIDKEKLPHLLSRAAPRTTFDPLPPGTAIALVGMSERGAMAFHLPEPNLFVDVMVGDDRESFAMQLDAVDIDAEERQARLLYRTGFLYDLTQFERRIAVLRHDARS